MRILAVVAYVAMMFSLSSWQNPPGGPSVPHLDKVVHAVEYAVLAILLSWAMPPRMRGTWKLAVVMVLGLLIGAADELYQRRVPGRESSVYDLVADMAGLSLGASAVRRYEESHE